MLLALTPPYLALLGAVVLILGMGEDASAWTVAGGALLLIGTGLLVRGSLRRRWIRRLRLDSIPIRAEVTDVLSAPFTVNGSRPSRLLCRGLTPPAAGRTFRSGWILDPAAAAPVRTVTVLLDPNRTARYLVELANAEIARPLLQRGLHHLGAAAIVLGVGFAELVAIDTARPPAPVGSVHGEVEVNGARFGKGGLHWRPDLCRAATTPGVTAVAVIRKDDPYPVAWIIADPSSNVAAIDVQRFSGAETVRFMPATCTRLHGTVSRATAPAPSGPLEGFVDAECRQDGGDLTLHVDFADCR